MFLKHGKSIINVKKKDYDQGNNKKCVLSLRKSFHSLDFSCYFFLQNTHSYRMIYFTFNKSSTLKFYEKI